MPLGYLSEVHTQWLKVEKDWPERDFSGIFVLCRSELYSVYDVFQE